jgi:hypothetical protein
MPGRAARSRVSTDAETNGSALSGPGSRARVRWEQGAYAERSDGPGASAELDFCGTSVGLFHQAGGLGWEWGVIRPDTGHALVWRR